MNTMQRMWRCKDGCLIVVYLMPFIILTVLIWDVVLIHLRESTDISFRIACLRLRSAPRTFQIWSRNATHLAVTFGKVVVNKIVWTGLFQIMKIWCYSYSDKSGIVSLSFLLAKFIGSMLPTVQLKMFFCVPCVHDIYQILHYSSETCIISREKSELDCCMWYARNLSEVSSSRFMF